MRFERRAELFARAQEGPGALAVVLAARELGAVFQHAREEEAEPDALAFAERADTVHAVVPVAAAHQGQTVRARGRSGVDRAQTVLVERGPLRRHARHAVDVVLLGLETPLLEERDLLVEHGAVARDAHVLRGSERQPQHVVGAAACARPRRSSGCHQCCTSPCTNWRAAQRSSCSRASVGAREQQREHVLQLVAKAVRAAALVERRPRPQPAAQHLIGQEAVEQQVERGVGTLHLQTAEQRVPRSGRALERRADPRRVRHAAREGERVVDRLALAEREADLARLARRERDHVVQGRARLAAEPAASAERDVRERARPLARAVDTEKLVAVAGHAARRLGRRQKRAALRECREAAGREQRVGRRLEAGGDAGAAVVAMGAEHPVDEREQRQAALAVAEVAQTQAEQLERTLGVDADGEFVLEPVALAREHAVALAVAHQVGRVAARRRRGGGPSAAIVVVAQVDHLAARIAKSGRCSMP